MVCSLKWLERTARTWTLFQRPLHEYDTILKEYNSEVRHLNNLKKSLKRTLLTASSRALKVCLKNFDPYISYETLHKMAKRATPEKLMMYKLSLQLHKLVNHQIPVNDWLYLNEHIIQTSRQQRFKIAKHNRLRLGFNTISNRLWYLNDKIQLDWLNLSFETFKIKMKELFITETWGNGMPNNIINSIY